MRNLFDPPNGGSEGHAGVGKSDRRTPAKHQVLKAHISKNVFAAPYAARKLGIPYGGFRIIDLTAGDAAPDHDRDWLDASSPAIMAALCTKAPNLQVIGIERARDVYEALIENLTIRLPTYGFQMLEDSAEITMWRHRRTGSTYSAMRADGKDQRFDNLEPAQWLYVFNDPNNMHGWCLDVERLIELSDIVPVHFMSTMGCNPSGLKRLSQSERDSWYDHVAPAKRLIEKIRRLDLLLFAIRDDAQWAYLLLVPSKWIDETEAEMVGHFKKNKLIIEAGNSFKRNPIEFKAIIDTLFQTNKERADGHVRLW